MFLFRIHLLILLPTFSFSHTDRFFSLSFFSLHLLYSKMWGGISGNTNSLISKILPFFIAECAEQTQRKIYLLSFISPPYVRTVIILGAPLLQITVFCLFIDFYFSPTTMESEDRFYFFFQLLFSCIFFGSCG